MCHMPPTLGKKTMLPYRAIYGTLSEPLGTLAALSAQTNADTHAQLAANVPRPKGYQPFQAKMSKRPCNNIDAKT